MAGPSKERVVALLTGAAGFAALAAALCFRDQIPIPRTVARTIGFMTVFAGVAVFIWAAFHLKSAIGGLVTPRLTELVIRGPFRFARHPTYLAMMVALIGASTATRSAVGLAVTLVLFLPVEIFRAQLEERALYEKFGQEWKLYASRTGFFLPRLGANPKSRNNSSEL